MARGQSCHGEVPARVGHCFAGAIAGDIAETVEFTVEEQHRLKKPSTLRRCVSEGNVGGIVQIPGIPRAKPVHAERIDENLKVRLRPKCPIRLYRRSVMLRSKPTATERDDG